MARAVKRRLIVAFIDNLAVESSRRALYRELARNDDFDVHLIVPTSWREQTGIISGESETDSRLTLHQSKILFNFRAHRVLYTHLGKLLRSINPDFLYVDTEPENYLALQSLMTRNLLLPSMKIGLVSSRNIDHRTIGFPYKAAFTHLLCDTITLPRIDICFLRTMGAANFIQPYVPTISHIPFPVDCTVFKKHTSQKSDRDKKFIIGFVGRYTENKGVRLLVEALQHLPQHIHLLFVGQGPLEDDLREQSRKLHVSERVTIQPSIPYARIPDVMNSIDILVLPSQTTTYWMEQCPRILIEAMACEVPIVASRSGGIPEVLGDAGLLFEEGNVEDLVEQLRRLIEDIALRKELVTWGRERALRTFDVPVIASTITKAVIKFKG